MTPADPVCEFRARRKTTHRSVYTASRETFASPLPPSPFLGPDRDADRMAHRPTERDQLAREARRLAARGLTPRDVATALRLSDAAVVALLEVDHARE